MPCLLRVSMTSGRCGYEPLPEHMADLGGRGLAAALVAGETPPDADPMGPDAVLVFAPGLLTGSRCANAGRMSIGFKSPCTGLLHEANTGGVAGSHLARLGIAGLIVEGHTKNGELFQLEVAPDSVRLVPATVRGLGNIDVARVLAEQHGAQCSRITIGQAGEMRLPASGIAFTDRRGLPTRHAGRGGGGAVMGSKGLKAVVITPPEQDNAPIRDPAGFSSAARRFAAALAAHRNNEPGRSGRGDCTGCIVGCPSPSSPAAEKRGTWPGYETLWRVEGNTADDDAAAVARFGEMCNDTGLDAFETALGLAALHHAGRLRRGDAPGALELVAAVQHGTTMGILLGSGWRAVADACGLEKETLAPLLPKTTTAPAEGKDGEALEAAVDTLGICRFAAGALRKSPEAKAALVETLNARFGRRFSESWLEGLGHRVLSLENTFTTKATGEK